MISKSWMMPAGLCVVVIGIFALAWLTDLRADELCPNGRADWNGTHNGFVCHPIEVAVTQSVSWEATLDTIQHSSWTLVTAGIILAILFGVLRGYRLFGVVVIPSGNIGQITKKFSMRRHLPDGRIIATEGEAGWQANTLAPGIYFGFWPWQFAISIVKFVVIEEGHVGVVEAIDGEPIPPGHILGRHVECNLFQDAVAFLKSGGQRGPQADILPPGNYRINSELFSVEQNPALDIPAGKVAIVTTKDGAPLATGDIAGREIAGHSSFQDASSFIAGKGSRGLQEQVMMPGRYYVNPRFIEIELVELTSVPIGSVGVVISYVGDPGVDTSGEEFTHGNIVGPGQKGVLAAPLDPGRYPLNARTMRVEIVPTTNTVLNWITGYGEAHGLDDKLESIEVRSKDGFSFPIEVSQIIHISAKAAPRVIARFGTVKNLVSQVLEPTIDNYFRNSAQGSEFLNFLSERVDRQKDATQFIRNALKNLDVEAVDTLIGDIDPPPALMETLTARKIAEQTKVTFGTQQASQEQRQLFEQAKAEADTRGQVVQAARAAEVAKLAANATISKAEGEARAKTVNAEADATVLRTIGDATAAKTQAVGEAEAKVLKLKVESAGQSNYALMNVIEQLSTNKIKLVPDVSVTGAGDGKNGTMIEALMGNLLARQSVGASEKAAIKE